MLRPGKAVGSPTTAKRAAQQHQKAKELKKTNIRKAIIAFVFLIPFAIGLMAAGSAKDDTQSKMKKKHTQAAPTYKFTTLKVINDPTNKLPKKVDFWTPFTGGSKDRTGLLLPHGKTLEQSNEADLFRIEIPCYFCFVDKLDLTDGKSVRLSLRTSTPCSGRGCEASKTAFGESREGGGYGEIGQFRTFIEQKQEKAKLEKAEADGLGPGLGEYWEDSMVFLFEAPSVDFRAEMAKAVMKNLKASIIELATTCKRESKSNGRKNETLEAKRAIPFTTCQERKEYHLNAHGISGTILSNTQGKTKDPGGTSESASSKEFSDLVVASDPTGELPETVRMMLNSEGVQLYRDGSTRPAIKWTWKKLQPCKVRAGEEIDDPHELIIQTSDSTSFTFEVENKEAALEMEKHFNEHIPAQK